MKELREWDGRLPHRPTDEAVERAWARVKAQLLAEAPEPEPELALPRKQAAMLRPWWRRREIAAAAVLLIVVGFAARILLTGTTPDPQPISGPDSARGPGDSHASLEGSDHTGESSRSGADDPSLRSKAELAVGSQTLNIETELGSEIDFDMRWLRKHAATTRLAYSPDIAPRPLDTENRLRADLRGGLQLRLDEEDRPSDVTAIEFLNEDGEASIRLQAPGNDAGRWIASSAFARGGRVVDQQGRGIAGAWIQPLSKSEFDTLSESRAVGTTAVPAEFSNANGEFAGLLPSQDDHYLLIAAPLYRPRLISKEEYESAGQEFILDRGASMSGRIELPPGLGSQRLVMSLAPWPPASEAERALDLLTRGAERDDWQKASWTFVTDSQGRFTISGFDPTRVNFDGETVARRLQPRLLGALIEGAEPPSRFEWRDREDRYDFLDPAFGRIAIEGLSPSGSREPELPYTDQFVVLKPGIQKVPVRVVSNEDPLEWLAGVDLKAGPRGRASIAMRTRADGLLFALISSQTDQALEVVVDRSNPDLVAEAWQGTAGEAGRNGIELRVSRLRPIHFTLRTDAGPQPSQLRLAYWDEANNTWRMLPESVGFDESLNTYVARLPKQAGSVLRIYGPPNEPEWGYHQSGPHDLSTGSAPYPLDPIAIPRGRPIHVVYLFDQGHPVPADPPTVRLTRLADGLRITAEAYGVADPANHEPLNAFFQAVQQPDGRYEGTWYVRERFEAGAYRAELLIPGRSQPVIRDFDLDDSTTAALRLEIDLSSE